MQKQKVKKKQTSTAFTSSLQEMNVNSTLSSLIFCFFSFSPSPPPSLLPGLPRFPCFLRVSLLSLTPFHSFSIPRFFPDLQLSFLPSFYRPIYLPSYLHFLPLVHILRLLTLLCLCSPPYITPDIHLSPFASTYVPFSAILP